MYVTTVHELVFAFLPGGGGFLPPSRTGIFSPHMFWGVSGGHGCDAC